MFGSMREISKVGIDNGMDKIMKRGVYWIQVWVFGKNG